MVLLTMLLLTTALSHNEILHRGWPVFFRRTVIFIREIYMRFIEVTCLFVPMSVWKWGIHSCLCLVLRCSRILDFGLVLKIS